MTAALVAVIALATTLAASAVWAADYAGPIIDAHSHVPNATAIDAYVEAMKRHRITRVILLGVGGVQKDDPAWIAAAARKHPDRVVAGAPVPDPTSDTAAARLDRAIEQSGARAIGEIHVRQVSRKIERDPSEAAFGKVLEVAARRKIPVVIHQELDDQASAGLEKALAAHRGTTIILAHAGGAAPARLEGLLTRHPNLLVDLSGMHFERTPALATETGPLDPAFKALVEKMPARFLIGIDVWAARLFDPAMLDRLMKWTRRILGELKPEVAERVAWKNAAAAFRIE